MEFKEYETGSAEEVKKLFTSVFTDSEGQDEGELIGNLVFEMQDTTKPDDIFGFIALEGKNIIGCVFFTRMEFENKINAFILSPAAIATQHQKQGIGQKLIEFSINCLKKKNVKLLFTYGDPSFYSKVGFKCISENIAKAPLNLT